MRTLCFAVSLAAVLALAGCGGGGTPSQAAAPKPAAEALPAGLLLTAAPARAKEVAVARKEAKPGDTIVVRGRIGGVHPFGSGSAIFTVVDSSLPACNEKPGDTCAKPWDFCCDTPKLPTHSAAVQVLGASGKILRTDLQSAAGLGYLDTVVVTGAVDAASDANNLVVNATGIFVEQKGNPKPGVK